MANFYVVCKTCEKKLAHQLKKEKRECTVDQYEELVLFETEHAISATEQEIAEAMICPRCNGSDCEKTYYGYNTIGYIRGNGYLDKAGCTRDMNLHRLVTEDPYGHMRVPGEVDDLKARLKRGGQHNPKAKHYVAPAEMQKAVHDSVAAPNQD